MNYYTDLYGVTADQETFLKHEAELIRPLAERLMEILNTDLDSCYSESRGGICYATALYEDDEEPELDIHLHPNHVIESDGDYWVEEQHKQFALLLYIGCERKDLIDRTRMAIKGAPELKLTLIRSTYSPNLEGGEPDVVTFSLTPEPAEEQGKR